jgi:hypothetical protein
MYSKFELKNVTVKLVHEDCWTSKIENSMIRSLGRIAIPEKSLIRAFMIMRRSEVEKVISLEREGKIKNIINISYTKNGKYIVDMLLNYKNSTLELLNKYDSIIVNMMNMKGREVWDFITYEYNIPSLLKDLESHGKIEDITITTIPHNDIDLTSEEFTILITALQSGYFEYPRKVTAKEIAKKIGIHSSTFLYHIRNAEKKIISKYIYEAEKKNKLADE